MKHHMKPLFSVVIPLYNKRAHIVRTIESVLAQTEQDFELIIVDDGSTDGSANLVAAHFDDALQQDGTLRIIRQMNGGVSLARNRGIAQARGRVVAFIDADDTWAPHFLAEMATLRHDFPDARAYASAYQLVVNDAAYMDPKIRSAKPISQARQLDDFFDIGARGALPFTMSSFCVEKSLLDEIGGFPVGEAMGEDQDVFCRTALSTHIAYSPSVLSFYHHDAQNRACSQIVPAQECPFSRRLKQCAENHNHDPKLSQSMREYSAAHLLHIASLNVRLGRQDIARSILSDERCKLHKLRHLWWTLRSYASFSIPNWKTQLA